MDSARRSCAGTPRRRASIPASSSSTRRRRGASCARRARPTRCARSRARWVPSGSGPRGGSAPRWAFAGRRSSAAAGSPTSWRRSSRRWARAGAPRSPSRKRPASKLTRAPAMICGSPWHRSRRRSATAERRRPRSTPPTPWWPSAGRRWRMRRESWRETGPRCAARTKRSAAAPGARWPNRWPRRRPPSRRSWKAMRACAPRGWRAIWPSSRPARASGIAPPRRARARSTSTI